MPKERSAGALIFRKEGNKIYYLLLRHERGHWDFPKGHIEQGEEETETVKREVEEETGLKDIRIVNGFREHVRYFFRAVYDLPEEKKKTAPWIFKLVTFYLAETKTREIKISDEHTGYKWLLYEDALKQSKFKNAKELLKKANTLLKDNGVIIKSYKIGL